jgi:hypothetical protein
MSLHRAWPSPRVFAACAATAAVVVALDAWFASRVGSLSRPPDYDGVTYMVSAQQTYGMLTALHVRAAAHIANSTIAPLWTALISVHYLVFGPGFVQAFASRFWPTALLLALVYWIVDGRAGRRLAIAAVVLTALLPIVSAAVRSSSWELLSGPVSYDFEFGLDDLRPDFMTAVLALWSVAAIAEHSAAPRRSGYLVSAFFAAAAVLFKQSTSPLALAAWGTAVAVAWFVHRRDVSVLRLSLISAAVLVALVGPWAVFAGGARRVIDYLYITEVTYGGAYGTAESVPQRLTYFPSLFPFQLGHVEVWLVVAAALVLLLAMARRMLGASELTYFAVAILFYVVLSLPTSRNSHLGIWISLALWIFAWAGIARLVAARWPSALPDVSRTALAVTAVYAAVVYGLGAYAIAAWPASDLQTNAQKVAVTSGIAQELSRHHVGSGRCFTYAPGPGWPGSIEFLLMDRQGRSPTATATEVDISKTTVADYVAAAQRCDAFVVYQEPISAVARAFYAPPVYQPYFEAVADWVKSPGSGYSMVRSWTFTNLPPFGYYELGRYTGISLTVELYFRDSASTSG